MQNYLPYASQALALALYCACILLVTIRKIDTRQSVKLMFAGSGFMAVACRAAGDTMGALSCIWIALCVQVLSFLAFENLKDEGRTCAVVLANSVQVVVTMTMVAEVPHSGPYVCVFADQLAALLVGLVVLSVVYCREVWLELLHGIGSLVLYVAIVAALGLMIFTPSHTTLITLPGLGPVSLAELVEALCALRLANFASDCAQAEDDVRPYARLAFAVMMLAVVVHVTMLGDAGVGIAIATCMAMVAITTGERVPFAVASLAVSTAAGVALSLIDSDTQPQWVFWLQTSVGPFASVDCNSTLAALYSGDSVLFGCGVGHMTQAMWEAPYRVAWPLVMSIGTFGFLGFATFVVVGMCSLFAGLQSLFARMPSKEGHSEVACTADGTAIGARTDGGRTAGAAIVSDDKAADVADAADAPYTAATIAADAALARAGFFIPSVTVVMAINLLLGLLAAYAVIPDLQVCGLMFLHMSATWYVPVFQAVAVALAFGCDVFEARFTEAAMAFELPTEL